MDEFDLIVSCPQRNGLVFELATLIMSVGFKMANQSQLDNSAAGIVFALKVRGDRNRLAELQQRLQSANFIEKFELSQPNAGTKPAPLAPSASLARTNVTPTNAQPVVAPARNTEHVDHSGLDLVLPKLAAAYPNFMPLLEQYASNLAPNMRTGTMRAIGARVGAWVYKRDYALGAKMELPDFLRRVLLPASKSFAELETGGRAISLLRSSFAKPADGMNCQFFSGFFSGFASESKAHGTVQFEETQCRSAGASKCTFTHS